MLILRVPVCVCVHVYTLRIVCMDNTLHVVISGSAYLLESTHCLIPVTVITHTKMGTRTHIYIHMGTHACTHAHVQLKTAQY